MTVRVDWVALLIVTLCCCEAARKFVVAAPSARTTQVPAPEELNVAPLTNAHGPLTRLYVNVEFSLFVVEALTVKFPPRYVGVGAVSKVIVGAIGFETKFAVTVISALTFVSVLGF